jgi:hypothetical protein
MLHGFPSLLLLIKELDYDLILINIVSDGRKLLDKNRGIETSRFTVNLGAATH